MINYKHVLKFARFKSGSHLCDSGFGNGRHWQQPAPVEEPLILSNDLEYIAINTVYIVSRYFSLAPKQVQDSYRRARVDGDPINKWFHPLGLIEWLERRGYREVTRDNTYNRATDLSQDIDFSVWHHAELSEDYDDEWWYQHEGGASDGWPLQLVVLNIHTGADVRGGYAPAMLVVPDDPSGDGYTFPMDLKVVWDLYDEDGERIEQACPSEFDTSALQREGWKQLRVCGDLVPPIEDDNFGYGEYYLVQNESTGEITKAAPVVACI